MKTFIEYLENTTSAKEAKEKTIYIKLNWLSKLDPKIKEYVDKYKNDKTMTPLAILRNLTKLKLDPKKQSTVNKVFQTLKPKY